MMKQITYRWREGFMRIGYLLLLFVIATAALPAAASETPLKKVSLALLWSPQAQFAGYYVALDKGIYAKHGMELKILAGGPGHSPVQTLNNGTADFAILWLTTALQQRAAGIKLVNVAQLVQKSSMMLISRKSSGIKTVADMNGRKVGLWGGGSVDSAPRPVRQARHQSTGGAAVAYGESLPAGRNRCYVRHVVQRISHDP